MCRDIIADVTNAVVSDVRESEAKQLVERLCAGDLRSLSRAISSVESGGAAGKLLTEACQRAGRRSLRIGVTGPPGVGKSTLVDQILRCLRTEGRRVGVLAVDPSSPVSGGALLGDRIRMQGFTGDPGVYIRSLASRGALGGVTETIEDVCAVVEAAGFDVVVVETVGVGQEAVDVVEVVDVTVLVLVPGMGDEVQSMKSGVMELADVFVVNKTDRGGAEQVEAELLDVQSLAADRGGWTVPVVKTSAATGEGVAELIEAIGHCRDYKKLHAAAAMVGLVRGEAIRLDHLGIAVRSIASARVFYESLGLRVTHEETVEHERVHTAMLPVGETRLELLEATEKDSTIGRFVEKRGEGLHHVALRLPGIDMLFQRLQGEGIRLASDSVRVGAGGHGYFFVHPASTGGVLLEVVGQEEGES